MSWEAVTWATRQRMKSSHEQLVLLVLANAADPDGVAFARWPGREHWWKYLVDLTRLSKSTLFRDINTLIEAGLCSRTMLVMSDGTRRPTIQLNLNAIYKFDKSLAVDSHSHTETDEEEYDGDAENRSDINDNDDEISSSEIHSHTETSPAGGNDPFPIVGMHRDSNLVSKDSPLPPSGGMIVPIDEDWQEFITAWGEPIQRMALAKGSWDRTASDKRSKLIAAARGLWTYRSAHPKSPSPPSAQSFIRDEIGWDQWLPYTPRGDGMRVGLSKSHQLGSREAKAIIALYEIAGLPAYPGAVLIRNGVLTWYKPITLQMLALADVGPKDGWIVLTRQQAAAWNELLRGIVTVATRRPLREGDRAPREWPPRKDGLWPTAGPPAVPDTLMTEDDMANI